MRDYNFYVYILKCCDSSYYAGVTNNIDKRLSEHENGLDLNSYTYTRRPLELVLVEEFNDIREAIAREKQIKKWTRKKKEALINNNWEKLHEFAECKNLTHYLFNSSPFDSAQGDTKPNL